MHATIFFGALAYYIMFETAALALRNETQDNGARPWITGRSSHYKE